MPIPSVIPASVQPLPVQAAQLPDALQKPAVAPVTSAQGGTTSSSTDKQGPNEALEQAVETLNDGLKAWSTSLRFEIDPELNRVVVHVVDTQTGEVVRQIPSEEVVHLSQMLGKLQDLAFRASA